MPKIIIRQNQDRNFSKGYDPIDEKIDVLDDRGNIIGQVLSIQNISLSKGDVEIVVDITDPIIIQKMKGN